MWTVLFTGDSYESYSFGALLPPPHSSLPCSEPQEAELCGQYLSGSLAHWAKVRSQQETGGQGERRVVVLLPSAHPASVQDFGGS